MLLAILVSFIFQVDLKRCGANELLRLDNRRDVRARVQCQWFAHDFAVLPCARRRIVQLRSEQLGINETIEGFYLR